MFDTLHLQCASCVTLMGSPRHGCRYSFITRVRAPRSGCMMSVRCTYHVSVLHRVPVPVPVSVSVRACACVCVCVWCVCLCVWLDLLAFAESCCNQRDLLDRFHILLSTLLLYYLCATMQDEISQ
jgi:hypothetical protein